MPIAAVERRVRAAGGDRGDVLGADAELEAVGAAGDRTAQRGGDRGAAGRRVTDAPRGRRTLTTAAGRKFIAGEPMKEATKLVLRAVVEVERGADLGDRRRGRGRRRGSASVIASTWSWVT